MSKTLFEIALTSDNTQRVQLDTQTDLIVWQEGRRVWGAIEKDGKHGASHFIDFNSDSRAVGVVALDDKRAALFLADREPISLSISGTAIVVID